jgi:hypothetical protein
MFAPILTNNKLKDPENIENKIRKDLNFNKWGIKLKSSDSKKHLIISVLKEQKAKCHNKTKPSFQYRV